MNRKFIWFIIALLVFLFLIIINYEKETPEQKAARIETVRKDAYDYAVRCSGRVPALRYKDITWITMPGRTMRYDAVDGSINLDGYFSPTDSVIYVAELYETRFWVLAHESMHAIGVHGHPDEPFRRCKLLSEQN